MELSPLDTEIFGIPVARFGVQTVADAQNATAAASDIGAELVVLRCPVEALPTFHWLQANGFRVTDTLVHYVCNLQKGLKRELETGILVRPFKAGEESVIAEIAGQSFENYPTHFHADNRLDREQCNELYRAWAKLCCASRGALSEVFVAEHKGQIVGFVSARLPIPSAMEGVLAGVSPRSGSAGTYVLRALVIACMRFGQARGARRGITSSVVANVQLQKIISRLGWEQSHAEYTLHRWTGRATYPH